MINANVFRILTLIALVLVFFTQTATGQVNQYERDGLSFSYPADWPLSDESDATAQTLNLDRGQDEAKILILALRQQLTPSELDQAQIDVTEAIVGALLRAFAKAGVEPERSAITETIAGVYAEGTRLRATVQGQPGNADIYWLVLGGRLIHLVYMGSDEERMRATDAWKMVISTLRVGSAEVSEPDLTNYSYQQISGKRIELHMAKWGRLFVSAPNTDATAVAIPRLTSREFEDETIGWSTQADFLRGKNGRQFTFICPPNGTASRRLWGSGFYTDDPSICTAGVHAGVITLRDGGIVTIEIRPGIEVYASTTRNGITSLSYDFRPGSFVVIREGYNRRGQGSVAGLLDLTKAGDFGQANTHGSES